MIPPEPEDPSRPAPTACRAAAERTARFLAGPLDTAEQARLGAHLEACPACRQHYDTGVRTAAQLGRRRRLERGGDERARRRAVQRRLAFAAGGTRLREGRAFRLRTLLLPALAVFLLLQIAGLGSAGPDARIEWREGRVLAAQRVLEAGAHRPIPLADGDWCATAAASRARVSCGATTLELESDTRVWIASLDPPHLRLERGALEVEGPCTVTTPHGVVELSRDRDRARVEAGARGTHVRCLTGAAVAIDPRGETRLVAGQAAALGAISGGER